MSMKKRGFNNYFKKNYKKFILGIFLALLVILIAVYINIPYNCKYDENCFNERFENCKKTDYYKVLNGDTYQFEVKGKYKDSCLLNIKLIQANQKSNFFVKENMEGRGMLCKIPRDSVNDLNQINNTLDYCTGPLKESMLEYMIKNLFELVVENIGPITTEMQKTLENKTF